MAPKRRDAIILGGEKCFAWREVGELKRRRDILGFGRGREMLKGFCRRGLGSWKDLSTANTRLGDGGIGLGGLMG